MSKRECKVCNESEFQIYPNGMCQKCLSLNFENSLKDKGKDLLIDSRKLIDDYLVHFKSMRQIARENNIKPFQVKRYLNNYSIPVRNQREANAKYINKEVFKELNVSSAFLLGYIFTDGDLLLNQDTGMYFLRIYSKHRYKIENVKKILSSDAKIQHRKKQKHKEINQSEMFFIHIGNQDVILDLMDFGMVLNKNSEIKFPEMPEHLIPHFIRGVWSGSGCVSVYKNTVMSSLNNGSLKFIKEIENRLNLEGLTKRTIHTNKHSKKPSFLIKYATKDSEKLYHYMYDGVTSLTTCKRQEQIFLEYFSVSQLKFHL